MKIYCQTSVLILSLFLGVALVLPGQLFAAGGGGSSTVQAVDPDIDQANLAIKDKNWSKAIEHLNAAIARDDKNAEAYNLRGYSERMHGDLDAAFRDYDRALELDPKHRGAHEYVGEAYLMVGNLAKAEEHLAILDKLCFFPCEEYTDLKGAISEYKGKQTK